MYSLSLRTIASLVVLVMGTLAIVLALYTGEQFHDAAIQNQRSAYVEILGLRIGDKLNSLEKVAAELGQAAQNDVDFRKALATTDKGNVTRYLRNQFHQYFVTAGALDLYSLIAYDNSMNLIGFAVNDNSSAKSDPVVGGPCARLISLAKKRSGATRYKRMAMMCKIKHHPSYHVLIPIGGLRIIGYLDIVTNPVHSMSTIGGDLGLSLSVNTDDGNTVYRSPNWPKVTDDAWHLVASYHQLMPDSKDVAYTVSVLRDIRRYHDILNNKRNTLMSTASALTLLLALVIFTWLNKSTLRPLAVLAREINNIGFEDGFEYKTLKVTGNQEVKILTENFNQLIQKLHTVYNELHLANADLRANSENLEDIVHQRTADLAIARDTAVRANQSKSQFLANMSHELRTPLNAIIGYSEMMLEDAKEVGDTNKIEDLSKINSAGQHLLALIKDILDLSKIEAGRMDLEITRFNIPQLVKDITNTVLPLFSPNDNELSVIYDSGTTDMFSDATKLRQAILNLLGNAAKFTQKGKVQLTVSDVNYNNQAFIEFNVTDTGIGLSDDQKEKIFDSFSQADLSTTRKYGGTGLGLTISRRYCQMMGGTLTVSSQLNVGSTFSIRVPREIRATTLESPPSITPDTVPVSQASQMPVACIISKYWQSGMLSESLRELGFNVHCEGEILLLRDRLRAKPCQLLLVDYAWLQSDVGLRDLLNKEANVSQSAIVMIGAENQPVGLASDLLDLPGTAMQVGLHYSDNVEKLRIDLAPFMTRFWQPPIMLVCSSAKAVQPLSNLLRSQGWKTCHMKSLTQARNSFLKTKASAIVMDMGLYTPESAAWMDSLRFRTPTGTIPIILCGAERDCSSNILDRVDKVLNVGIHSDEIASQINDLLQHQVA